MSDFRVLDVNRADLFGANRSRIVRRWKWEDCPAISVEVWSE